MPKEVKEGATVTIVLENLRNSRSLRPSDPWVAMILDTDKISEIQRGYNEITTMLLKGELSSIIVDQVG